MRTILVAVDFSDVTQSVLEEAVSLAKAFKAKVHLLHVAAPDPDFVGFEVGPQHERDFRASALREEHRELNAFVEVLKGKGVEATCSLIGGATAQVILEQADEWDAGYVVMGSHGHGAVYSLMVGSVTNDVLRGAKVPLLVVPAQK